MSGYHRGSLLTSFARSVKKSKSEDLTNVRPRSPSGSHCSPGPTSEQLCLKPRGGRFAGLQQDCIGNPPLSCGPPCHVCRPWQLLLKADPSSLEAGRLEWGRGHQQRLEVPVSAACSPLPQLEADAPQAPDLEMPQPLGFSAPETPW